MQDCGKECQVTFSWSFELLRGKSGVHTIKRSGKVLGDFSYDSDADNFVANMKGMKGQW